MSAAVSVLQIDVAPTLYELAGVETPASLPGRSLLARFGPEGERAGTSFAWLERPGLADPFERPLAAHQEQLERELLGEVPGTTSTPTLERWPCRPF